MYRNIILPFAVHKIRTVSPAVLNTYTFFMTYNYTLQMNIMQVYFYFHAEIFMLSFLLSYVNTYLFYLNTSNTNLFFFKFLQCLHESKECIIFKGGTL